MEGNTVEQLSPLAKGRIAPSRHHRLAPSCSHTSYAPTNATHRLDRLTTPQEHR